MSLSQERMGWDLWECDHMPPPHWAFWFLEVKKRGQEPVSLVELPRVDLMAHSDWYGTQ